MRKSLIFVIFIMKLEIQFFLNDFVYCSSFSKIHFGPIWLVFWELLWLIYAPAEIFYNVFWLGSGRAEFFRLTPPLI